jgi:predicted P-loop ATPase
MKVSIYQNIKHTTNGVDANIEDILEGIKAGRWQDVCFPVMNEINKTIRSDLKKKVPYFTASGTFSERKNTGLSEHSGLIAIDFDEVDNLNMYIQMLSFDPYTFATFKSVSHTGFCALVKIDPEKHLQSFEGLGNYYFQLLKIPIDPSCKDISRPRFVSFDPDLYCNPDSKVFKEYPKKETKQQSYQRTQIDYIHTNDKFDRVLKQITRDITGDYNQWVRLGFAIGSEYGSAGEDYYHYISKFSPLYDATTCSRQYKFCCKIGSVKIGTFYYYANQYGCKITDKDEDYIAKVTHYGKSNGKSKEDIKQILVTQGITTNDAVIDAVLKTDGFTPLDSGDKLNIEDVEIWLRTNFAIKKNCVTRAYELAGKELETEDFNTIYIAAKKVFEKLSREIFDTIIFSHFTTTYNPIKEYFESLQWDGQDRLQQLCSVINSDTGTFDYRKLLLQSWLIGIVETIYLNEPNVLQLILAGKQNTGKSVFFKRLLPKKLNKYFGFSQLDKGKDDELLMCQKLIILDDEYSGKSKLDAKLIKRLLSAPSFDLREPYGKRNVTLQRIATLCATSNETELLNDPTGNRRNIIFEVIGNFDYQLYNQIDKEGLFAQIVHMFNEGYRAELPPAMITLIEEYTADKHSETSIEAECILMQFEPYHITDGFNFLTATKIKDIIEKATEQKINIKKLGMELKRLNYLRLKKNGNYGYFITPKCPN